LQKKQICSSKDLFHSIYFESIKAAHMMKGRKKDNEAQKSNTETQNKY